MAHPAFEEIFRLPVDERIRLVEDLWNSIPIREDLQLSPEQQRQLDAAIDGYERDPEGGIPWEEVKAHIISRPLPG